MTDSKKMASIAVNALEEKKANDVKIIDIEKISTLADYFIISSGSNRNQVQAMADAVEEDLGKAGFAPKHIEGYATANWILMDYGDIVVNIFNPELRERYNLEGVWGDCSFITIEE